MSTYTKDSENIYFLNDKNITSSLIDDSVLSNAIPSHELFKDTYDGLSTYDNNLCIEVDGLNTKTNAISSNLCSEVKNLSDLLSIDLSNEISSRIKAVQDLSSSLSSDINSLSDRLSVEINSLSTSLSNTVDKKFVLKTGDLMETLSVAGKTELSGDIVVPNYTTRITIGNAVAPREGMFVWNGKENYYKGQEIDEGKGNTFNINPNHELCGVFVGEKSLCAYITEDVALTATNIRSEINTVSSLLTGNYALSSDVSAVSKLVNDAGYLVSNNFNFEYDSATKAIWLSAGSKTISVDAADFIKDGMIDTVSVITENRTYPELQITFNTDSGKDVINISLEKLVDIYKSNTDGISVENYKIGLDFNTVAKTENLNQLSASFGTISANHETRLTAISNDLDAVEINITNLTAHTKSLQNYVNTLSGNGSNTGTIFELSNGIKQTNEKHQQDFEYFNNILQNNATFAGTIQIDIENNIFKQNDKLSALLEKQNSNSNRVLKSGDIYQIEFINNDFTNNINDPFRCEKTFYDTSDKPSVRLAHKDYIVIYTPNIGIPLTYDNVHEYAKVIPAVRFYELYQLSVTVSSDYFWLSGGNNNIAGHAISGDNDFIGNNYFEGISASIISSNNISAINLTSDSLSASLISVDSLSASKISVYNMSVDNLSARNISVDWKNVKHSDNGYSLYDLSVALSNKIYIDDRVDKDINGTSDLSIVKISKKDYDSTVALKTTPLSVNVLYVVDSDYIDAYGQVIRNLTMDEDLIVSEATNKHYVDSLCASLSDTVKLSVENLQDQIIANDNDIEYLSGQYDWLSTSLSNDIDSLSDSLSTTTKLSVENLQGQLTSNDADIEYLSGQHDWLSTSLSTDIDNLSTSLSNTVKLSVEELQGQLTSNDADIEYLSGQHDWLSTALSNDINTKADNNKLSNYILKTVITNALSDITEQSELSTIRNALINLKTALTI